MQKFHLLANENQYCWRKADRGSIPVSGMTNSHLRNAVSLPARKGLSVNLELLWQEMISRNIHYNAANPYHFSCKFENMKSAKNAKTRKNFDFRYDNHNMKVYRTKEDTVLSNGTFIKSGSICIRSDFSLRISFSPTEVKTPGNPGALPVYDADPIFLIEHLDDVTDDIESYMRAIEIADEYRKIIGKDEHEF